MPCRCEQCSNDPLPTFTEEHKYSCLVREIAKHDAEWIKRFLKVVLDKSGREAWEKLRNDVRAEWRRNG
jgi:hypothetical protein